MTQDDALNLLSARIDGPLNDSQQADLNAWLSESSEHRVLAEAFETQHHDLHATFAPRREAAAQTAAVVAQKIKGDQLPSPVPIADSRGWFRRWIALPIPATIAAAVVVGLALFFVKRDRRDPEVTVANTEPGSFREFGLKPRTKPAAPKTESVATGSTVVTTAGEKKRVALPDGSLLYLNQNTTVDVTSDRRVKLRSGEVFVEVVPATSGGDRFVVETAKRTVTALGTKFAVSAADVGTGVRVTQGKVEVSGLSEKLTTGQELTPSSDRPVVAARASCSLDWTRDLIVAAESPLVPAGKYSGGSLVAVDPYGQEAKLHMVKFHVDVHIEDGFARTTIDQTYFNSENQRMEGTFYFPLPPDASLSRLAMYVDGDLMEGGMAEAGHARNVYETIRYQNRDPALLEWIDGSVFKMRVFPLEARQEKRIVLSYTQRLAPTYGRMTYRFPAGHSLALVNEWSFNGVAKNGSDLSVNSPSHPAMKIGAKGKDLVMTDSARGIKIDRDIVLELMDHQAQGAEEASRWSSGELDGKKYLMFRYRPSLPTAARRERRDWVILFEASAGRDPLVARAQVEVVRSLMSHAEHDDTFAVMTVGTRARQWKNAPVPASPDSIAQAMTWLESSHLIGATNLDQAISDAEPLLRAGTNSHLVHVGGGVASIGEQRADELVRRLPGNCRYVGIAVGKRFSPAFMKVAAERTGGLFTQVNPDEAIAWRGFEIASTLNAPRLLNVRVECDNARFLSFAGTLAHGEELAAVANVTDTMPTSVKVRGVLDGQPFERVIPVNQPSEGAGYLPRSWAKLEIDRLLADNSTHHRQSIIDLSKAMYVMTPFTSLLVLENEQMYRDFKVDRGRKDHWALYPCPAKIPVVYVPDPNRPIGSVDLKGQKPHRNQVVQTVVRRPYQNVLNVPGVAVPDQSGQTDRFNLNVRSGFIQGVESGTSWHDNNAVFFETDGVRLAVDGRDKQDLSRLNDLALGDSEFKARFGNQWDFRGVNRPVVLRSGLGAERDEKGSSRGVSTASGGEMEKLGKSIRLNEFGTELLQWQAASNTFGRRKTLERPQSDFYANFNGRVDEREMMDAKKQAESRSLRFKRVGKPDDFMLKLTNEDVGFDADIPADQQKQKEELVALDRMSRQSRAPSYHQRPGFNGNMAAFNDLPSYAPGLSSSTADIKAVIESEAAPRFGERRGSIDPKAREIINAARSTEWRITLVPQEDGKSLPVYHDGTGRYTYQQTLPLGLVEIVVCDGESLWHLYPEIGLGARRTVSRHHRQMLFEIVPDFVPPADDLNYDVDVTAIDANTVALIPVQGEKSDEKMVWMETHLVFAGNRLVERRWVLNGDGEKETKLIARETYSATETKQFDAEGKERLSTAREMKATSAPSLVPETSKLVVLPLPLRTRDVVYRELELDPSQPLESDRNGCYPYLSDEGAMRLLVAEFASNHGPNLGQVIHRCFHARGDRRPGLYVLLAAINNNPWNHGLAADFAKDRTNPLLAYLRFAFDVQTHGWQSQYGTVPHDPTNTTFLGRLWGFREVVNRWNNGLVTTHPFSQRDSERQRALEFAVNNADNALGWCATCLVQDRSISSETWAAVAKTWKVLTQKSHMKYAARYEEARALGQAENAVKGSRDEARAKFQALYTDALKEGILPPIDDAFRSVLESGQQDEWAKLVRQAASRCAEKKARPVIVTLAWQCYQLGDVALSDTLLDSALANVPNDEKAQTTLAAIQFLQNTGRHDRADVLVRELLSNEVYALAPGLWRLASEVADNRRDPVRSIVCLEKALDLEFARMPEVFDVQPIRNDYGRLLSHYEWLADSAKALNVPTPSDLIPRLVKAADRWRSLDNEANQVPGRVATILRKAGGEAAAELAWDYATTPLGAQPNESGPWVTLAQSVRQEGNWRLADKCYEMAFAAEPTNAQLLWDRASHLQQQGQIAESRVLMKKLADSEWQPRFAGLKAQARQIVGGLQ